MRVDDLQGRYFIPVAPALLLLCGGIWQTLPPKYRAGKSEIYRNTVTAIITLISCIYMLTILYFHYYVWAGMDSV